MKRPGCAGHQLRFMREAGRSAGAITVAGARPPQVGGSRPRRQEPDLSGPDLAGLSEDLATGPWPSWRAAVSTSTPGKSPSYATWWRSTAPRGLPPDAQENARRGRGIAPVDQVGRHGGPVRARAPRSAGTFTRRPRTPSTLSAVSLSAGPEFTSTAGSVHRETHQIDGSSAVSVPLNARPISRIITRPP